MTPLRRFVLAALLVLASLGAGARAQPPGAAVPECPPVADTLTGALAPPAPLPRLAAALRPGGHLAVLAVGSASTAAGLYLAGLRQGLAAARPDLIAAITVAAARGEDAADALGRLQAALGRARYDLVLWQTGTVDAVRGASPDALADALDQGAQDIAQHGASLVLIDPQFSRLMRANVDLEPYETALRAVALRPDAALFPRG
ncbi:MAG: hypothetical protein KGI51_13015, partial [Rhodospirillales bacterium]|nr:hypothetical protein [Rhodospirillales bacterium]